MRTADGRALTRRKFFKWMFMAGAAAAVDWDCIEAMAANVKNKDDFPVVVIGAGLGGLVSAAYMAKYGFPVTLLEQHELPGGYATSFDRGKGRFTFEVSLHATVAEHAIPQRILSEVGVWDKVQTIYTPELCRLVSPHYDLTLPSKDPEKAKAALGDVFPEEKAGINGFIDDLVQVQKEMRGHMGQDSVMARLEPITLAQWLDSHIQSREAKDALSAFWAYYGLPPSRLNALFYAIATGEYLVTGGQYYKARSQDLSDKLMEAVETGGRVILETAAEKILLKNGAVAGVLDASGEQHPAKAVIANASVPAVFGNLISRGQVPSAYLEKLSGFETSLSSFIVWLGLNKEIRGQVKGYEIFVNSGPDPEKAYQACVAGDLENTGACVTVYDNLFAGYSQPGASTVSIMTLSGFTPWKKYEEDYIAGRKKAYRAEKERIARLFIDRAAKTVIPDLESMIEVMDASTPLTNQRYTRNPGGAIYGFNRMPQPLSVKTPITGLYLASAWTHGGGYTPAMMAGRDAAQAVLKDWNRLA